MTLRSRITTHIHKTQPFRLITWFLIGAALYAAVPFIGTDNPQWQVVAQKWAHVAGFAWLGYMVSRHALGRIDHDKSATEVAGRILGRAILMGACILAGASGL